MSPVLPRPSQRKERLPVAFGCAVLLLFAVLLFAHGGMPVLGDYGEWTYHGVLLRDVLVGRPDAHYLLKHYPVPNSLTTVGMALLMVLLPWKVAAKVWLCVELGLGMFCGWRLNRASIDQDMAVLWVLPGAMLCGLNFWAGFSNFMFGVYFAALLVAMLLRGARREWMLGAVLLLLFFSHMVPFVFGCLLLVAYAAQTRRFRVLWQMAPGVALTAWYVVGRFVGEANADGKAGMESSTRYMSGPFALFKVNSYLKCWGLINPALGPTDSVAIRMLGEPVFAGLVMVDLLIAGLVGVLLWESARRSFRGQRRDQFLWAALGIFAAVSFVMPGTALGISDPGGRMLQTAIWVGVVATVTTRRWQGMSLAAGSVVLMAANLSLFATVGFQMPTIGATVGRLPPRLRVFGHVYYADRADYPASVEIGEMDRRIYPTALFLRRP